MSREVRARIGAARLLLETVAGKAAHEAASRTQCIALLEVIKRSSLSVGELVELSELALEVAWVGDDSKHVAEALVPSSKAVRSDMQDYQHLHEFFLQSEWDAMLDASATFDSRLEVIVSRAVKLGCHCPSEFTLKHMTSLLLVLCAPADRLPFLTAAQKGDMKRHLKAAVKKWVRRAGRPAEHVDVLPATMAALRAKHPSVVEHAYFAGELPIACVVDIKLVYSLNASYRCRDGPPSASSAMVPMMQLSGQVQQQGFGQLELVAMMMMDNMARLQVSHGKLHACLSGNGGSSLASLAQHPGSSIAGIPSSLQQSVATTAAVFGHPHIAAPVLHRTPARLLALSDATSRVENGAQHVRIEEVAIDDAALDGEEAADSELEQAAKEAKGSDGAIGGTARLLELLDDRDADKRAISKEKGKSTPKAKGKLPATGKGGAATPKSKGGAATPKRKAKTPPKVEAKNGKRPFYTIERSRNQVLCRTGKGGPKSTSKFSYGPTHAECKTEATAVSLAKKWLTAELKRQGWD